MSLADASGDGARNENGDGATVAEILAGTWQGGGPKGVAPGAKVQPFRAGVGGVKDAKRATLVGRAQAVRVAANEDAASGARMDAVLNYATRKGRSRFAGAGDDRRDGDSLSGICPARHPNGARIASSAGRAGGKKSAIRTYLGYGAVRSRMNLLEGEGNPGAPETHPVTGETHPVTGEKSKKSTPEFRGCEPARSDDADSFREATVADSPSGDGETTRCWRSGRVPPSPWAVGFAVVRLRRN